VLIKARSPKKLEDENCFFETFDGTRIIEETGAMEESLDPNWWLNSGAYFFMNDGIGHSIQGQLPEEDVWRHRFFESKPETTLNGYRPQNIFRLLTRKKWENISQSAYFKIKAYDLSSHEDRNQSNALLLFGRYIDSDNLYYAGLRVDGNAVVKKKLEGTYYTLGITPVIEGQYDRVSNPLLLPYNEWIGVKFVVQTLADTTVLLELYLDIGQTGNWNKVLSIVDVDGNQGLLAIRNDAHAGIRTDFMDVLIKEYSICEQEEISDAR
jgi:hypothetical protein